MASNDEVLSTFDHHVPNEWQKQQIQLNRQACKTAAAIFLQTCPDGADRSAALRLLHEAMMTANKAVCNPPATKNTFLGQGLGQTIVGYDPRFDLQAQQQRV